MAVVTITGDSAEAVAYALYQSIASVASVPDRDLEVYTLSLYSRCLAVANGKPAEEGLSESNAKEMR